MLSLLLGLLLICASAAGWVLIGLCAIDVVRQRRAVRAWRPDTPRGEDLP